VEAAEEIIRETCKELDIQIIDMAVNVDHIHLFIEYPPKYSVSWIARRIKGRSSKMLRDKFPQLKELVPGAFVVSIVLPRLGRARVGCGGEVYIWTKGLLED